MPPAGNTTRRPARVATHPDVFVPPAADHPARGSATLSTGRPVRGSASVARSSRPPGSIGTPSAGRRPWSLPLAVVLVLLGVFATGAGLGRSVGDPLHWATAAGGGETSAGGTAAARSAPRPVSLTVAAVDISAPVKPVGDAPDGTIGVPPLSRHEETGWYDRGPVPGEPGPAVIVGHVDTKSGPSVFYHLHRLRVGDTVEVKREDGSVVVFTVDSVEHFPKDQLPADRVYGHDGPPSLRLITCGGQWVGGPTGYADNVIAFASHTTTRSA